MNDSNFYKQLVTMLFAFGRVPRATRHPDGQIETDATHTVMLAVVACEMALRFGYFLDFGLITQFATVHDLPEVYAGDTNTLGISPEARRRKHEREQAAHVRLHDQFGNGWLMRTLDAYERQDTPEARFVKLVDKVLPKFAHELNQGATFKDLGMSPEAVLRVSREQVAELDEKYGAEFPAVVGMLAIMIEEVKFGGGALDAHNDRVRAGLRLAPCPNGGEVVDYTNGLCSCGSVHADG